MVKVPFGDFRNRKIYILSLARRNNHDDLACFVKNKRAHPDF